MENIQAEKKNATYEDVIVVEKSCGEQSPQLFY